MGVESLDDAVVAAVRKNNPFAVSKAAVGPCGGTASSAW